MDEIYTYIVPLPPGVNETILPCADGYTVYLSDRLDEVGRIERYHHALRHIHNNDFSKSCVQEIEYHAHKESHEEV